MKITFTNKTNYSEEGQPNPIRWAILSGSPETGFVNESAWLRCKDFFNDYAIAYNGGPRFNIYGFSTEKMTIPEKGQPVYIAVKDLTPQFEGNLSALNASLTVPILFQKWEQGFILCIDSFYWNSTYHISLISLMIRLCNVSESFKSLKDMKEFKGFAPKDQAKWDVVVNKNVFFDLPHKFHGYTWYCDNTYNSKKAKDIPVYQLSSLIHNNGVLSYSKFL